MRVLWMCVVCALLVPLGARGQSADVAVEFTLAADGYVTIVIEDGQGARVRNLVQNTFFSAGTHTVQWDGYDVGRASYNGDGTYDVIRDTVSAGTYHLKAITHDEIAPVYEFSVQSPGAPPWHTTDGTGGWLADHGPGKAITALPAGTYDASDHLQMTGDPAEAGHGVIYVTEAGVKVQSLNHVNGGFRYYTSTTRDTSNAYAPMVWGAMIDNGKIRVGYFNTNGQHVGADRYETTVSASEVGQIAAYDTTLAVSYDEAGLLFIDASDAVNGNYVEVADTTLADVRGLATDGATLYTLIGTTLQSHTVNWSTGVISGASTLVSGLEDPQRVKLIGSELYVTDHGASHQVKVYDTAGTLQRTIGTAGGPQLGAYDETKMSYPLDVAVDSQDRLWVAEDAYMPKRISRWNATTGAFIDAFYGPPKYGGGLYVNPLDSTKAFYSGPSRGTIEFGLKWTGGTSWVNRILHNREIGYGLNLPATQKGPDSPTIPIVVGSDTLLTQQRWSGSQATIYGEQSVWAVRGDSLAWVMQVGRFGEWQSVLNDQTAYPAIYDSTEHLNHNRSVFIWTDENGDGDAQLAEFTFYEHSAKYLVASWVDDDLSVWLSDGIHADLDSIDVNGVPHYSSWQTTPWTSDWERVPVIKGDSTFISGYGPLRGYVNGSLAWEYHAQTPRRPGVSVPSRFEGDVVEATRFLGHPYATGGESIWGLNSEKGEIYLFTEDGYFITTLLGDTRTTSLWRFAAGDLVRGDTLPEVSPNDEHFWPWLSQSETGQPYLVAGKEHHSILRLDGLDSITRQDFGTVAVTSGDLSGLPATDTTAALPPRQTMDLYEGGPSRPSVDGNLSEWPDSLFQDVSSTFGWQCAAGVYPQASSDSLYVACNLSGNDTLFSVITHDDITRSPIQGGVLDVWWGQDNADLGRTSPVADAGGLAADQRYVARTNGPTDTTYAALYEQNVTTCDGLQDVVFENVEFSSPIKTVILDCITDVSSAVQLARVQDNIELALPMSYKGTHAIPDTILWDVCLITSSGSEATARWCMQDATSMVSDEPTEMELRPGLWGKAVRSNVSFATSGWSIVDHTHVNLGDGAGITGTAADTVSFQNMTGSGFYKGPTNAGGGVMYHDRSLADGDTVYALIKSVTLPDTAAAQPYEASLFGARAISLDSTRAHLRLIDGASLRLLLHESGFPYSRNTVTIHGVAVPIELAMVADGDSLRFFYDDTPSQQTSVFDTDYTPVGAVSMAPVAYPVYWGPAGNVAFRVLVRRED